MRYYSLILAHIVLNILAFHLPAYLFFISIALSWIMIPSFFLLNGYKHCVIWLWFAFAINNFVDELLKNNVYHSTSEYIFAMLITYIIIKMKCQQRKS